MYQNFIIPYLYKAQHVSVDTPPIIRSLKLHWQPLVFHTWKAVGRCQAHCAWQRPRTIRPTTFHVWKTRGFQCSFRLLMMGGVSPETCWALYKYVIIKFWYIVASWIFLYELYYDARIHEHQILQYSLWMQFECLIAMCLVPRANFNVVICQCLFYLYNFNKTVIISRKKNWCFFW